MAISRDKPAKPKHPAIGSFITSGELGTIAMHLPGKRSIGITKWQNHKALLNRNAREGAAALPYTEDLFR
jgi:hypothetical protein